VNRLVIGVGNPTRGDGAAGLEVARRMQVVPATEQVGGSLELIDLWDSVDEVVVVDAARSGAPAGTIHRFDAAAHRLPASTLATSTHSIGVSQAVELARALKRLPPRLTVYGIEIGDLSPGAGLSPAVAASIEELVEELDHA